MKRLAMILAVIFAAGAGAYATTQSIQERPSNEPVQVGAVYLASFCGPMIYQGTNPTFYMRINRELSRGWFEVDWSSYQQGLEPNPSIGARQPDRMRVNLNSLCFVKPIMP